MTPKNTAETVNILQNGLDFSNTSHTAITAHKRQISPSTQSVLFISVIC